MSEAKVPGREVWNGSNGLTILNVRSPGANPGQWFEVRRGDAMLGRFGSLVAARAFLLTFPG